MLLGPPLSTLLLGMPLKGMALTLLLLLVGGLERRLRLIMPRVAAWGEVGTGRCQVLLLLLLLLQGLLSVRGVWLRWKLGVLGSRTGGWDGSRGGWLA